MFRQEKDIFNILLDAVSEGVIVVNTQQKIIDVNKSAANMFGYQREELIDKSIETLIPSKYHKGHSAHFDGFMKQRESRQMGHGRDLYGARKDGSTFPVEAGLNPFTVQDSHYVMALVIDISVRKQQEEKIQELYEDLEQKVIQRTQELSKSIAKLEAENILRIQAEEEARIALKKEQELNELKTKFLSLVSHEFKTPLSSILTSSMLLGKYKLTEQQTKRDRHIQIISDKVHYLNNILNDFLSVEKLEKGKVNYKLSTFKVSKVVNEVVYNANMLLKDGQQINYPEDIDGFSLYQDEKIVELALSNLVNNAIKYSSENTIIDILITQDITTTTFKIKDNGIGIPEKEQKNIFNRYFRAENALLVQGTGIGLNIVKSHLENLNGSISFESAENKGSIFTINIPNKATTDEKSITN
ncbi:signal transduction histidine-protein kinase BarA [Kordia sp. SMS9]|uniref:PAS domain-containing sensor histidine kinase n=1 Tax=Kordia sp. SMS9 TaxID=2282170 RepID=UPI000E0D465D|nr:PAS domain-containing sensor histidine kinase [Kordia sp. SMS9]AXG70784.1 signal transduction histidine-protein kinase BarA [Kordia sp. SMS9]